MTSSTVHSYCFLAKIYPVKTLQFPSKHQAEGKIPLARTPLSADAQPQLTQGCKSESEVNLRVSEWKAKECYRWLQRLCSSWFWVFCKIHMNHKCWSFSHSFSARNYLVSRQNIAQTEFQFQVSWNGLPTCLESSWTSPSILVWVLSESGQAWLGLLMSVYSIVLNN